MAWRIGGLVLLAGVVVAAIAAIVALHAEHMPAVPWWMMATYATYSMTTATLVGGLLAAAGGATIALVAGPALAHGAGPPRRTAEAALLVIVGLVILLTLAGAGSAELTARELLARPGATFVYSVPSRIEGLFCLAGGAFGALVALAGSTWLHRLRTRRLAAAPASR